MFFQVMYLFLIVKYLSQFLGRRARKPESYRDTLRIFEAKSNNEIGQRFYNESNIFCANTSLIPSTSHNSSILASFIFFTDLNFLSKAFFFASPIPSILSNSDCLILFSRSFLWYSIAVLWTSSCKKVIKLKSPQIYVFFLFKEI